MNNKITVERLTPGSNHQVTDQIRSIANPIEMPVSRLINYNFFKDIFSPYLFTREIKSYSESVKNFKSIWPFVSCCKDLYKDLYKEVCDYRTLLAWSAVGGKEDNFHTLTSKQFTATIDRLTMRDKLLIIKSFDIGNPYLEALTSSLCIKIVNYFKSNLCVLNYLDISDNKVFNLLLNSGKANNLINIILASVCQGPIQTDDFYCYSIKNTNQTWNEQFLDLIINLGKTGLEVSDDFQINKDCKKLLHAFFAYRLCKRKCPDNFRYYEHFSDNKLHPLSDVIKAFIMLLKTGQIDDIAKDVIENATLESVFSDDPNYRQSINNLLIQLQEIFKTKKKISLTEKVGNFIKTTIRKL